MKKFLLFSIITISLTGLFQGCKDPVGGGTSSSPLTVAKKQRSLVVYNTATWCGPCGLYAKPEFNKLVEANDKDNVVPVSFHNSSSSSLVSIWAKPDNDTLFIAPFLFELAPIVTNMQSIPHFWLNNSFLGTSNVKFNDLQSSAANANGYPTEVGVAASASASGMTLNIKYKLKAFAPEKGDYYVSAFVVEKKVNALQTILNLGVVASDHYNVMRASAINNASGKPSAFSATAIMSSPIVNAEVENTISWTYTDVSPTIKAKYVGFTFWNWNPANTGVIIAVWRKLTDNPLKPWYLINTVWADVK